MQVIPTLRIRDGATVGRLAAADPPAALLDREPAAWARWAENQGAAGLHVIDDDGDHRGQLCQFLDLLDVLMAVSIPVQVSAGLRRAEEIGQVLSRGAARAVIRADDLDVSAIARLIAIFGERLVPSLGAPTAGAVSSLRHAGATRWLWRSTSTDDGPASVPEEATMRELSLPVILQRDLSLAAIRVAAATPGLEAVLVGDPVWRQEYALPEARRAAGEV